MIHPLEVFHCDYFCRKWHVRSGETYLNLRDSGTWFLSNHSAYDFDTKEEAEVALREYSEQEKD